MLEVIQHTNHDLIHLSDFIQSCQNELKSFLKDQTDHLFQGTEDDGSSVPLDRIYTELYITEGGSGEVNTEHEVIQLECQRSSSEERKINLNDIFKPLSKEDTAPRRVLTKGIAGIGKTVSVLKFTQDWARGEANQNIQFLFPFTFRELNLMDDEEWSLLALIGHHYDDVKGLDASNYEGLNVLFIFDGLDESKFPLNFKKNKTCCSVTKPTTVDVLLTNLINGKLMHKASVWITSRPAASAKIPPKFINRVTEVRGFSDEQKVEYFQRKVSDQSMAQRILDHLQSKPLRSLYIMCHIPVFCWISAETLQSLLTQNHSGELPKTVTEMYTHFLIVQRKITQEKDYQDHDTDKELIVKLGKLAFEQLQKGNIIFEEDDFESCGIALRPAADYSGVCTQIIKKEHGFHKRAMYCFIHLSVQEFLAALYVLETFLDSGQRLLVSQTRVKMKGKHSVIFLHRDAVDLALASDYGQWDLFLRFLLGLSQDENQKLMKKVLRNKDGHQWSNEVTIDYIHDKIKKLSYTDQSINLFHCLSELGDRSLVEQVQNYQRSGDVGKISPSHWSALAYLLLVSSEDLNLFDLRQFSGSDEVLERLLPVFRVSKKAVLTECTLTDRCCSFISSVLSWKSCVLEELDLSRNQLQDSGMNLLSEGLRSPNCKLQKLLLMDCGVTKTGCQSLGSALTSNPSHLKDLDLSKNKLLDEGLGPLSEILHYCSLETLRLCECGIAGPIGLNLNLRNLDLSRNPLGGPAIIQLCCFLKDPGCRLERLWLSKINLRMDSAAALTSALAQNPSHLRELDLGSNNLGDGGASQIAGLLRDPNCRVETLRLAGCRFSQVGCKELASSLRSNPAHLRVLDLWRNDLRDAGVEHLSHFLDEPLCELETLSLKGCSLTAACCPHLTHSGSSSLKDLDLSYNQLTDQGVELLCDWLKKHCCLETLRLSEVTNSGCASLASALRSNVRLRELYLGKTDPGGSGVERLSELQGDSQCGLKTLVVTE
ncbi:NACHT, LRR and PYD domains-containing protein 12-like [Notolabrus celidotus]|uniref:NACHT, LRR and PYD domains-containing protein 12-like n=1 Tax=Notolabrus celidotus TaxID=1203425 RepID=UPI00148FDB7C|nr:NACHT, LRR and PYD domains-containing protein 12-like [Notolabrus celidotus]